MKKLYALLFLAVSATFPLFSQSGSDHHPKWVDYTGTHEVDVSVGFPTACMMYAYMGIAKGLVGLGKIGDALVDDMLGNDPEPVVSVEPSGKMRVVPNLRAEYGYNFLSWLNVGAAVNYSDYRMSMKYEDTGQYAYTEQFGMTSVTVRVKFYWLNRKWVRMYSAVGAGVGIVHTNAFSEYVESPAYITKAVFAPDLCLIGLTVGRKLYGRIEYGSLYGGLTAGIGYRF